MCRSGGVGVGPPEQIHLAVSSPMVTLASGSRGPGWRVVVSSRKDARRQALRSPVRYAQSRPMSRAAVLYARVSSKDQEREGFSIPAQLDLLRSYAAGRQLPNRAGVR